MVSWAEFDFEGSGDFSDKAILEPLDEDGSAVKVQIKHSFEKPGTYFPVLRTVSSRNGASERYTQVKNLVRVMVE